MISRSSINGKYPVTRLGEVVQFLDGQRKPVTESDRKPGPYPYFGANGQQGTIDGYLFDEPLVLLAEDGGHFESPDRGIAYRISGKTWVNNHAHVLRPKPHVNLDYLCRVIENYDVTPFVTGTTRGKLTKNGAEQIPIPLPPLPEQRRIAAILDKADELRAKRRAALAQLDGLTQAVFVEMFGDPATNPKRWPKRALSHVVDGPYGVKAGPFGSTLKKEQYTDSGYRVYGQEQVLSGRFDVGDYYISERKYQALKSCAVKEGDVLVSLVGTFGKVLVVPAGIEPGIINPRLLKVTPQRDLLAPEFLASLLQQPSIQREFERLSHGGTMGILNAGLLKRLKVPLAPLRVQDAFIEAKKHVARVRSRQMQSVLTFDSLFSTLQQQAFSGAL